MNSPDDSTASGIRSFDERDIRTADERGRKPEVRAGLPRLILWKRDVAEMLGVGLRTLERMIARGEIPAPDRRLHGRPAWLAATIQGWAANGCPEIRRPA